MTQEDSVWSDVAVAKGWFKQEGINVNITSVGSAGSAEFISGQVPFQLATSLIPPTIVQAGYPVSEIYATPDAAIVGYVGAAPGIRSISQCETVDTGEPRTTTYAYTEMLKKRLHATFAVNTLPTLPAIGTAVATGAADCGMGTYGVFAP